MENMKKNEDFLKDLITVDNFLASNKNEFGMNITMVHGFLYSMISSPCMIMPSDWMFVIFGGIPEFESLKQHKEVDKAILALHDFVKEKLLLRSKDDLYVWGNNGQLISLEKASDMMLTEFCSGYVKGYLLDPILKNAFIKLPDLTLSFFLATIKLGADSKGKTRKNINDDMRKTLQGLLIENYITWSEMHKMNLAKTYFSSSFYNKGNSISS